MTTLLSMTDLMSFIGALVVVTNIIVEVLKKLTWDKIPTSQLAFIVSLPLTIIAGIVYMIVMAVPLLWYYIVGLVVIGFAVAYAAMFGYELKRLL